MSKFGVSPEKELELERRMLELGIAESDLEERFVRGSGAGGQKINKTSSTVQLRHLPSGLEVRCQQERSQALNRFFARRLLCDRVERAQKGVIQREVEERERVRRQKRKRSKRAKEKMLANKKKRSQLKESRRGAFDK
jgi:protein subunit release factor B